MGDPLQNFIPVEVALHIFSYLDATELAQACLTCSLWNEIASSPHLWERHKNTM